MLMFGSNFSRTNSVYNNLHLEQHVIVGSIEKSELCVYVAAS